MSKLLKILNPSVNIQRTMKVKGFVWKDEGIQYPGFKYHPRSKDFKDPPYEPSKLFRVQRIKPWKGIPFNEKKILEEFQLHQKVSDVKIVKNIPENNHRLWKVKHLVKIDPITFPDGFPEDSEGTFLKENGELRVIKTMKCSEKKFMLTDKYKSRVDRMDGDTLRRDSRMKWLNPW